MEPDCNGYNQYSDTLDPLTGLLVPEKCFKGSVIYSQMDSFNVDDYSNYNSNDYYTFIKKNFEQYSFPEGYKDLTFDQICKPEGYSLKQQQKFAGMIFNTHNKLNGMLIYHGLGSGKTQTSIVIGEAFKQNDTFGNYIPGRAKTVVTIAVPASLVDQYYSQILGNINNGLIRSATGEIVIAGKRQYYLNKKLRDIINNIRVTINNLNNEITRLEEQISNNPKENLFNLVLSKKQQVISLTTSLNNNLDKENRIIKKVYEVISHETFLSKFYSDPSYHSRFNVSNGLLIVDEAHKLVSAIGTNYRKLLYAIKFHSHKNFKVVLLTGTPIYDKPYEFALLINLLKPRVPLPDGIEKFNEYFIEPITGTFKNQALFKQLISGYVSYFKGGNPVSYPHVKKIIMHHSMNTFQYEKYRTVLIKEIKNESPGINNEEFVFKYSKKQSNSDDTEIVSVFNISRMYCNIVFPEISPEDVSKFKITGLEKSKMTFNAELSRAGMNKLKKELLAVKTSQSSVNAQEQVLKTLENYSSKFAKIIRIVGVSKGPVFIYSNYNPYGIEAIAMILNVIGYTPLNLNNPALSGDIGNYFIWNGKTDKPTADIAKSIFNSPQNINGNRLKIILGTQTLMEGVDFRGVRQVHIVDPWWNDSRMQQVMARAVRLCSHDLLPPEEQSVEVFIHLASMGSTHSEVVYEIDYIDSTNKEQVKKYTDLVPIPGTDDYNEVSVKVNVNESLTIIPLPNKKIPRSSIKNINRVGDFSLKRAIGSRKSLHSISVEQYMYSRSFAKLNLNRQFEQVIKNNSIDCDINANGNLVRLEECYEPTVTNENVYNVYYENYSTGERYQRVGLKQLMTMEDIFNNVARKNTSFDFINTTTGESLKLTSSLVIPENNNCEQANYNFKTLPTDIQNVAINKVFIKSLQKKSLIELKISLDKMKNQMSTQLQNSLTKILNQEKMDQQKSRLINLLIENGIGDSTTPWELESVQTLKGYLKAAGIK